MTPFKKAGYTKDTKFKVTKESVFEEGTIVWLDYDDGTTYPFFSDGEDVSCMYLPGIGFKDLEVYKGDK